MRNIKIGNKTFAGVDTLKVKNADNETEYISFEESSPFFKVGMSGDGGAGGKAVLTIQFYNGTTAMGNSKTWQEEFLTYHTYSTLDEMKADFGITSETVDRLTITGAQANSLFIFFTITNYSVIDPIVNYNDWESHTFNLFLDGTKSILGYMMDVD